VKKLGDVLGWGSESEASAHLGCSLRAWMNFICWRPRLGLSPGRRSFSQNLFDSFGIVIG
jgi:hypothetical protein